MTLFSYFISFLLGLFTLEKLTQSRQNKPLLLYLFLSFGLGLTLSALIVFLSFILFNQLNKIFILSTHTYALLLFTIYAYKDWTEDKKIFGKYAFCRMDIIGIAVLLLCLIPLWIQANYYEYGGWDAWAVWNFKSRFLFLAGKNWQSMFDPVLWRSSPHYPLFLPFINVWGWIFSNEPDTRGPMITSAVFTFLTCGLLFSIVRQRVNFILSIFSFMILLTLPFFVKLALSQYADIVMSFFLLAAVYYILKLRREESLSPAIPAGIFLGALSFVKPEGCMAALILAMLCIPFLVWRNDSSSGWKKLKRLFIVTLVCLMPVLAFNALYAADNITFINGLTSAGSPSTPERFFTVLALCAKEFVHGKWHGLWIILSGLCAFRFRRSFSRDICLIPSFLFSYLCVVIVYYSINTYFEIIWWVDVTFNRVLFSLLPLSVWWVFSSLGEGEIVNRG